MGLLRFQLVTVCVREYAQAIFTACNHTLPFSHHFLTPLCTGTSVNCSLLCLFSLPLFLPPIASPPPFSLSPPFAPSPPRNLPQALHLPGLSACFFIWLVATGGSTLADYNSAASHFRFIRAPSLCAPLSRPHSLPSPASIQTHSNSSSPHQPTNLHPPLFPPAFHIFLFRSARKI